MEFIEKVNEKEYEDFLQKNRDNVHFLQSLEWMKVSKYKGLKTHLVGVMENNKLIATALLLQKKTTFRIFIFYDTKRIYYGLY